MHVLLFLVVVLSLTASISHRKAHLTQKAMFQHNLVRQHLPPRSRQMKLLLCLQIYARLANVLYWKMNYIYCIRCVHLHSIHKGINLYGIILAGLILKLSLLTGNTNICARPVA